MSTFEIKMPKLGESITEGTIISWLVKIGDQVKEDDVLFEVNTAKVSAEIPSPVSGKIIEILAKEGDTIAVGIVVAIVQLENEDVNVPSSETKQLEAETVPTPATASAVADEKLEKIISERWYSPVVIAKAKEAGIDSHELESIPGTGFEGRLSKRDIESYIQQKKQKNGITATPATEKAIEKPIEKASTSVPSQSQIVATVPPMASSKNVEVIPMDPVRRIIADRMVVSKQISPHVTSMVEADVTNLVKWRERNKEPFKQREGISLTFMPAVAEAVAKTLIQYPRVNSSVEGYNILQKKEINIGIAVSLDNGNLIVPVVKNADQLNLNGLAISIASLAAKARRNQLGMDEIQGGTFTITNFGSFKSLFGTPIINQPEVAILGIGMIEKKPSVIETSDGDMIAIRHKMYLSLSYDHRVIDGSLAGNFLAYLSDYLSNWQITK